MTMTASDKILPGLLLATALLTSACEPPRPEGAARGPALFETCSACHGADGMGEQLAEAPALVGLSDWYLKAQLGKFQSGIRGTHHEDMEGLRMRPMSKALEEEGDVDTVVAHIVAMPKGVPEATLEGGRADKGQALYAVCAA